MGEIYLANDTVMHSHIVVKEMQLKNAPAKDRKFFEKRFEEEARLLFRLSSDIYSLGAAFHFLLTGDNPQDRDPFDFPPLSDYRDDIPQGLQDIFDKMLAMKRKDRYGTVEDVQRDLENFKRVISSTAPVSSVGGMSSSRYPGQQPQPQPVLP